jgi:hypothetical protein
LNTGNFRDSNALARRLFYRSNPTAGGYPLDFIPFGGVESTARTVSIGLLPDTDASQANPFVSVPLATGIGEARNALVARASFCLIAIGDSLRP